MAGVQLHETDTVCFCLCVSVLGSKERSSYCPLQYKQPMLQFFEGNFDINLLCRSVYGMLLLSENIQTVLPTEARLYLAVFTAVIYWPSSERLPWGNEIYFVGHFAFF